MPLAQLIEDVDGVKRGELLWRISLPLMCVLLMLLAIPLGYVNPRVGRSANLIVALLLVVIYLNLINIVQAMVVQERAGFAFAWWPVHVAALAMVVVLFAWRLKVNSRLHPLVMWSACKACFRAKESKNIA